MWTRIVGINNGDKKKDQTKDNVVTDATKTQSKKTRKSNVFGKIKASFHKAKSFDSNTVVSSSISSNEKILKKRNNVSNFKRLFSKRSRSLTIPKLSNETKVLEESHAINDSKIQLVSTLPTSTSTSVSVKTKKTDDVSFWGITNHGNTCYINSIIQCLNSIDCFSRYFVLSDYISDLAYKSRNKATNNFNRDLIVSFSKLLKSLWLPDLDPDSLSSDFKKFLSKNEVTFRSNDQQDAQEFLLFLLNHCHERLKEDLVGNGEQRKLKNSKSNDLYNQAQQIREQNKSRIHELFATYQQLTITCPNCKTKQYKLEPNLCLSLPVPAKTMEPLFYCFVEKDGSQIRAAMWINTITSIQLVRKNIAFKFRIDLNNILVMVVSEEGFGRTFQDSECAMELISINQSKLSNTAYNSNIWNGIIALEVPMVSPEMLTPSLNNLYSNNNSMRNDKDYNAYMQSSSNQSFYTSNGKNNQQRFFDKRSISQTPNGNRQRFSGNYDNLSLEISDFQNRANAIMNDGYYPYNEFDHDCVVDLDRRNANEEVNDEIDCDNITNDQDNDTAIMLHNHINGVDESDNNANNVASSLVHLILVHAEEIIETSYTSCWRRFSSPLSLMVNKEIEFMDLERKIINQIEGIYKISIQSKLKSHLKFRVWDGLNKEDSDAEITSEHHFPLLSESAESTVPLWTDRIVTVLRIVVVWSPNNAARLTQSVFCNLRLLTDSTNCQIGKTDMYSIRTPCPTLKSTSNTSPLTDNIYNPSYQHHHSLDRGFLTLRDNSPSSLNSSPASSLTLLDAWPPILQNASVEIIKKEAVKKQTPRNDDRNLTLDDCLKAYMSEEILDARDAWKCPNCHLFQRAKMTTSLYSLPNILVLHLKRFQTNHSLFSTASSSNRPNYSGSSTTNNNNNPNLSSTKSHTMGSCYQNHNNIIRRCNSNNMPSSQMEYYNPTIAGGNNNVVYDTNSNNKLNVLVHYPIDGLDMTPYLSTIHKKDEKNRKEYIYDLIAVCNHQGTLSTGHYTAFCLCSLDNKWRLFNDELVKNISTPEDVIQSNAYILFYERRQSDQNSTDMHWSLSLFTDNRNNSNNIEILESRNEDERSSNAHENIKNTNGISHNPTHSICSRPSPLDKRCNNLRNNTPIVNDDEEYYMDLCTRNILTNNKSTCDVEVIDGGDYEDDEDVDDNNENGIIEEVDELNLDESDHTDDNQDNYGGDDPEHEDNLYTSINARPLRLITK